MKIKTIPKVFTHYSNEMKRRLCGNAFNVPYGEIKHLGNCIYRFDDGRLIKVISEQEQFKFKQIK